MPNNQPPEDPHTDAQNGNDDPPSPDEVFDAFFSWLRKNLRRYWEKPREKSKWTEIATVVLNLCIAGGAIYSAWVFQGQLTVARQQVENAAIDARSSRRHARQQTRIAQSQFDASQEAFLLARRPYVGIASAPLKPSPDPNKLRVEIGFKNYGSTPATNVRITDIVTLDGKELPFQQGAGESLRGTIWPSSTGEVGITLDGLPKPLPTSFLRVKSSVTYDGPENRKYSYCEVFRYSEKAKELIHEKVCPPSN